MIKKVVRWLSLNACMLGIVFYTPLKAQVNDAGLWTSVSLEVKVVKKLKANVSQELRFNENITELGAAFTDIGLQYKVSKCWQISANYRFIQRRRIDDYYSFRHRFYVDAKYEKEVNHLGLIWRGRIQDQYSDIGRAADGGIPEYYLRNKFTLKWNTKKTITPYLATELFSKLDYPHTDFIDGLRAAAGIEYAFTKHHKMDVYYMLQKELYTSKPQTDFIIGIGYLYKL